MGTNVFFQVEMFLFSVISKFGEAIDSQFANRVIFRAETSEIFFSRAVGKVLVSCFLGEEWRITCLTSPGRFSSVKIVLVFVC